MIMIVFSTSHDTFHANARLGIHIYLTIIKALEQGRKEGNALFNDALNTFTVIWRQTYGEEPLSHIGYYIRLAARFLLYASSHRQVTHTTVFVTPVVEHWLE